MKMRSALCILLVIYPLGLHAQNIERFTGEKRVMANATWLLKLKGGTFNSDLQVLSGDRAALLAKGEDPVLIQRFDRCTFELRTRSRAGSRIDFTKVSGNFAPTCSFVGCGLTFYGAPGASCLVKSDGRQECLSDLIFPLLPQSQIGTVAASVRLMFDSGCGPYRPPAPRPRF